MNVENQLEFINIGVRMGYTRTQVEALWDLLSRKIKLTESQKSCAKRILTRMKKKSEPEWNYPNWNQYSAKPKPEYTFEADDMPDTFADMMDYMRQATNQTSGFDPNMFKGQKFTYSPKPKSVPATKEVPYQSFRLHYDTCPKCDAHNTCADGAKLLRNTTPNFRPSPLRVRETYISTLVITQ